MDEPHSRTLEMAVDALYNLLADACGVGRRTGNLQVLRSAATAGFTTTLGALEAIVNRRHDVGHPSRVTSPGEMPPTMPRGQVWRDLETIEDQFLHNGVITQGHAFASGIPLQSR